MKVSTLLIFTTLLLKIFSQTPGSVDNTFVTGLYANKEIFDIDKLPGGKILIAGNFNSYGNAQAGGVAILNSDFTPDTSFHPSLILNVDQYHDIAAERLPGGKVIIGGEFIYAGYNGLIMLNADGSIDTTFPVIFPAGTSNYHNVRDIALQPDGKILIGGNINPSGPDHYGIIRIDAGGNLDPGFTTYFASYLNASVQDLELQPDGKILVAGSFTKYNDDLSYEDFIRLNANGTLDYTLALTFNNSMYESKLRNDGKILIRGGFSNLNGDAVNSLSMLNSDGSTYTSFDVGIGGSTAIMAFDPLNRAYIGEPPGTFSYTFNGNTVHSVGRINADGSFDPTFHPTGDGPYFSEFQTELYDMLVFNSGNIAYTGRFYKFDNKLHNNIVLLDTSGNLSPLMPTDKGFDDIVYQSVIQPDGKIIAVGAFKKYGDYSVNNIARIQADGTLDASFVASITGAQAVALQNDGKIIVAGKFSNADGTPANDIVRLNSDGTIDPSFSSGSGVTGAENTFTAVKILSDGKILAAGAFSNYNGTIRNDIVRLNTNGSLDTGFDPGAGCDNKIFTIAEDAAGNYLFGGAFSQYQYQDVGVMFRTLPDGTLDNTFTHAMDNTEINAIAVLSDGKIMVGGDMKYGATAYRNLLRLYENGDLDVSFVPGLVTGDVVEDISLNADGSMYVAGSFASYGVNTCYNVALVNSDASLNTAFHTEKYCDAPVNSVAVDGEGNVIVSGEFKSINGASRNYIARLHGIGTAPPVCNVPTGLHAAGITSTTAKIKWDAMSGSESYRLQYRPAGTLPWTTKVSSVNQKKIKSLTPAITYEYHVRSECAEAEVSEYSAIQTFTTAPGKYGNENNNRFAIYPNPNNGSFSVVLPLTETQTEIKIYDMTGRLIYYRIIPAEASDEPVLIDLEDTCSGVAAIQINNGETAITRTIVVAK